MKAIVVLAHCNFDDVLCGVFDHSVPGRKTAKARARAILKDPELRHAANRFQNGRSEFLRVGIYVVDGPMATERIALIDAKGKKIPKKLAKGVSTAFTAMTGQPLGLLE